MPVSDGFLTRGFRVDRIQWERDSMSFFLYAMILPLQEDGCAVHQFLDIIVHARRGEVRTFTERTL